MARAASVSGRVRAAHQDAHGGAIYEQHETTQRHANERAEAMANPELLPEYVEYWQRLFHCTHSWDVKSKSAGKRKRTPRLQGDKCPFFFRAEVAKLLGRWVVVVTNARYFHNHEISEEIFGKYPSSRMLRDDDPLMTRVRRRVLAGEKTAAIHQFITEHSDKRMTKRDVYNLIQRIRKEGRGTDDDENSESDTAQQCGEPSISGEESRELTYEEKYAKIMPLCDAICKKIAELDGDDFDAAMRTFEVFRDYVMSMKDSTELSSFPEYRERFGLVLTSNPISHQR